MSESIALPSIVPAADAPPAIEPKPYLTIRPRRGWVPLDLRELWMFRDLFGALAMRDLKLRYKQTALGVIWVLLQPLMAAGVFSFVFGSVAKLPSDGLPYFVFSYAGLLGWGMFNGVLTKVSGCLVGNSHLISKVYFPRLILPISNIGSVLVDLAVAGALMAGLLLWYGISPGITVFTLPIWLALLLMSSLGIGLVTASLTVSYRDVQYILPVFAQLLLYASPVAYSIQAVPENLRWAYLLNPLTPPLEAIRASLLGTEYPPVSAMTISASLAFVIFLTGLYAFKRMEKSFADVI